MNGNSQVKIEPQNEVIYKKSLVPIVSVCMGVLAALLVGFYIFLRFYNAYTFICIMNPDGQTCTVAEIGKRSFASFIYFPSEVKIPETVDGIKVTGIGEYAAEGKSEIKTVVAGEGVTVVGENAFMSCGNLEGVFFAGTLDIIGGGAFRNCYSLENVECGGVKYVGKT